MIHHMAAGQLVHHGIQRDVHFLHQHQRVVGKVSQLVDGFFPVVLRACDDHLGALLPHFFEDFIAPLGK